MTKLNEFANNNGFTVQGYEDGWIGETFVKGNLYFALTADGDEESYVVGTIDEDGYTDEKFFTSEDETINCVKGLM